MAQCFLVSLIESLNKYLFKYANLDFKNLQLKSRILTVKTWIKDKILLENSSKIHGLLKNHSQPNILISEELLNSQKLAETSSILAKNMNKETNMKKKIERKGGRRMSLFSVTNDMVMIPKNFFNKKNEEKPPVKKQPQDYQFPRMYGFTI